MGKHQFPQQQIDDLEPDFVSNVVESLRELNDLGKPVTDEDLEKRIDEYFQFCQRTGNRPGIESLCFSLHISRTTLFNWNAGLGCTERRKELINRAKSFVACFMEQAMTRGKISPPSGIFLMKNWMNYKDTISFENAVDITGNAGKEQLSREEIAARYRAQEEFREKPQLPEGID